MFKFKFRVCGSHHFQIFWWIWSLLVWWHVQFAVPLQSSTWPEDQGHGLRIFMLKFYLKIFRISLFPNLRWILFVYRYWSKILCNTNPPLLVLMVKVIEVKVTDLTFLLNVFIKVFLGPHCFTIFRWILSIFGMMTPFYVVPPPPPLHDFKIKVTTSGELSCLVTGLIISLFNS